MSMRAMSDTCVLIIWEIPLSYAVLLYFSCIFLYFYDRFGRTGGCLLESKTFLQFANDLIVNVTNTSNYC